jgi:hypothetical protein
MLSEEEKRTRYRVAAPEGTWPLEEWPLDVQREDEHGVDLSQVEYNLSLTPAERVEQHYQARLFFEEVREAGKRLRGSAAATHPTTE